MKLHLPKVLLLATLCVGVASAKNLNVGSGTSLKTEKGFTVDSGEKVGYLDSNNNFVASAPATTNFSNNLLVKGNLTIKDGGEVKIIGKQNDENLSSLRVTGTVTVGEANSTGAAEAVLEASDCQIENLTINKGTVKLHAGSTDFTQGNKDLGAAVGVYTDFLSGAVQALYGSVGAPKQAQILSNLTINGGSLVMGSDRTVNNYLNKKHYTNGFGAPNYAYGNVGVPGRSLTLKQSSGDMKVYGFSIANSGMKIEQFGGTMLFRDLLQFEGSAENKITQSGGSLTIGRLGGDTSTVTVEQTGAGTMQLAYGTDFSKSGKVSMTQSGGGTIILGGGHDATQVSLTETYSDVFSGFTSTNTTYSIEQKENGGTIVLAAGTEITASEVKLNSATGTMYVEQGAKLNANTITINGGTLVNGYVEPVATLDVEGDINSLSDTMSMLSTVETGGIKGNVVVNSGEYIEYGNLEGSLTIEQGGQVTLNEDANVGDIVVKGGKLAIAGDATTGSISINGGTIEFDSSTQLTLVENATISIADGVKVVVKMSAEDLVKLNNGEDVSITLFDSATSTLEFDNTLITFTDGEQSVDKTVTGSATGGAVTVTGSIPEPTTATLSLLALAALAARRRRK